MRVAVTGSSGLIGSALVAALEGAGDSVIRFVRRHPTQPNEAQWDPAAGTIDAGALDGIDAVVHLAGEGIGERRWTSAQKRRILESRIKGTTLIAQTIARVDRPPNVLATASGVNFYGFDRGDETLDENSSTGDGFLAEVCRQWEAAAAPAATVGTRVVHVRSGIVLSARGGALATQLPLFRIGLGGRLGSGRTWWSWISLPDEVGVWRHVIADGTLSGAVNAVAPNPVRNADFAKALGRVMRRPARVTVPRLGPALRFGRQMASEVVFSSLRVSPARLAATAYRFQHPDVETALRAALART